MSAEEEVTVDADGSTTFGSEQQEPPPAADEGTFNNSTFEETMGGADGEEILEAAKGVDPVIYLLLATAVVVVLYFFFYLRKNKEEEDDFFAVKDVEKFDLKLPTERDEYYQVKAKCEAAGWEPGKSPPGGAQGQAAQNGPHRVMAQALMKRAIADIPIVTHIQKEAAGMNKLYSQSMCSAKQWRAYQAAEALVSTEVEDVRTEADEIEPGWSQVIWRQAMQYHNMLKQKHEQETKAAMEAAQKKKAEMDKAAQAKKLVDDAKARELAAEKAAEELIKAEEREKASKKAFSSGGMKKGFLDSKSAKKK